LLAHPAQYGQTIDRHVAVKDGDIERPLRQCRHGFAAILAGMHFGVAHVLQIKSHDARDVGVILGQQDAHRFGKALQFGGAHGRYPRC